MKKEKSKQPEIRYCGYCGEMIIPGLSIDGWNQDTGNAYQKLWYKCKNKKHFWDNHENYTRSENPKDWF